MDGGAPHHVIDYKREENRDIFNGNFSRLQNEGNQIKVLHFSPKNGTNCVPGEIYIFPGQLMKKENNSGKTGRVATLFGTLIMNKTCKYLQPVETTNLNADI